MEKEHSSVSLVPLIDPHEELFGIVCSCAVRYALGRQTYIPDIVQSFIQPYIPYMSDLALSVLERDVANADDYGDDNIDKPGWLNFLTEITLEVEKRKKEK